jgi:dihydroorotate dehydrogenase/NAD-dependent dihydropyrimidine dehydrogenase PreA subunit
MVSLEVEFAGLKLKNPVIAASAPPTETFDNIMKCVEAGVGAVVTKTSANFDSSKFILGGRRTYINNQGVWAQGTFRHETLTLKEGIDLVRRVVSAVDVPIIASVGSLTLDSKDWLDSCLAMQDAGASMIQLDLFYIPQPRSAPENIKSLLELLSSLTSKVHIPIAPKLNHDIPVHYATRILREAGIASVFLIDSVRVPVPIDIHQKGTPRMKFLNGARECSLFGEWQKPLTLYYTSVIYHDLGLPISSGGGFMDGDDAIEAIMWGATTVQFASLIIKHGYGQIKKLLKQIRHFLERNNYTNINQLRGMAHKYVNWDGQEDFETAKAVVNYDLCVDCGICTRTVFCEDIHLENGKVMIEDTCDGCGYCPAVCPVPGALQVVAVNSSNSSNS